MYVMWGMILTEFNMEQLIHIVQKSITKLDTNSESDLVTPRFKTSFKGYQQPFPDYIKCFKSSSIEDECNPVDLDLDKANINRLWDEATGVIEVKNCWMRPFLKVFGGEEGNGLSSFAVSIDIPGHLWKVVNQFSSPPKRDTRDGNT